MRMYLYTNISLLIWVVILVSKNITYRATVLVPHYIYIDAANDVIATVSLQRRIAQADNHTHIPITVHTLDMADTPADLIADNVSKIK